MLCKTGSSILSLCLMQNIAQSTMPQHSFKGSYSAYYRLLCLTHIICLVSSLLPFLFKWQLWQHEWLLVMQRTLLVTISQFMKMKPEYPLSCRRKELSTRLLHQLEFNQYTISLSDKHLSNVIALVMAWSIGLLHFRLEPRRKCSRPMAWSYIWTWDNSFLSMQFNENQDSKWTE